jgi:RecA-family ATPase
MAMADSTAGTTDNVIDIRHRVYLTVLRKTLRMAEFCQFVWPDGEQEGARFRPDPNFAAFVLVRGDSNDVGNVYVGPARTGSVFDLIDERETGASVEELFNDFIRTLPPSEPVEKEGVLGDGTNPVLNWDRKAAPERQWVVGDWLAVGTVTSLYGGGGLGKSLIAQQLATSVATGRPFFGLETVQGKVMFLACEDPDDELQRRQQSINEAMGLGPTDHAHLGLMHNFARAGEPNAMVVSNGRDGVLRFRRLFQEVRDKARDLKVKLLIIDNIAQVFGGNENSRPEVTQFCNALNGIAQELNCAVLLLGHPGKSSESEYSGSTAWDAAVRSRWYLGRPKVDGPDDEELAVGQSDLRVLRKAKANYSSCGDEIKLVWDRGAFREDRPEIMDTVDRIEADVRERDENQRFLDGLNRALRMGLEPVPGYSSPNYAPKLLRAQRAECKGMPLRVLERTFIRLRDAGEVVPGWNEGPQSKRKAIVVPKGHPQAKGPEAQPG